MQVGGRRGEERGTSEGGPAAGGDLVSLWDLGRTRVAGAEDQTLTRDHRVFSLFKCLQTLSPSLTVYNLGFFLCLTRTYNEKLQRSSLMIYA